MKRRASKKVSVHRPGCATHAGGSCICGETPFFKPLKVAPLAVITQDEYGREYVENIHPKLGVCLKTPWGHYIVVMTDNGSMDITMVTITGPSRVIHVVPQCSNVIEVGTAEV